MRDRQHARESSMVLTGNSSRTGAAGEMAARELAARVAVGYVERLIDTYGAFEVRSHRQDRLPECYFRRGYPTGRLMYPGMGIS